MKVIELPDETNPIVCPFCNQTVGGGTTDEDWELTPCEHTLFIALDEGFEYRSDRFNEHMNFPESREFPDDLPEYADEGGDVHIDSFTSKVTLPDAVKYAMYDSFSWAGVYYGFAPL